MTQDSALAETPISAVPTVSPISELTNDKTTKMHGDQDISRCTSRIASNTLRLSELQSLRSHF